MHEEGEPFTIPGSEDEEESFCPSRHSGDTDFLRAKCRDYNLLARLQRVERALNLD